MPLTTFLSLGDMYTWYLLLFLPFVDREANAPQSACVSGKDRLGWQYLVETADAMQQVIRKQQKMISDAKEQSQEMTRSINVAFAGLSSFIP